MIIEELFQKAFTVENLNKIYFEDIQFKSVIGLDNISRRSFENQIENSVQLISRKILNNSYQFSQYREKLIMKGRDNAPRVVSIPTIRDKLALKALFNVLSDLNGTVSPSLHSTINQVIYNYNQRNYKSYIKIDIKNFYPSIDHKILLTFLKEQFDYERIVELVEKAISQTTVPKPNKLLKGQNQKGVPQGLSISNILANIYLASFDQVHSQNPDYKIFRFVDDILLLSRLEHTKEIESQIVYDLEKLKLTTYTNHDGPRKYSKGKINEGFEYLGYKFENYHVSVRSSSKEKIHSSIIKQFTYYSHSKKKNIEFLKWAIDLRITGCIFNDTKYGWLFYFSQINDHQLLFSLDNFIRKMMKRFAIDESSVTFKKFVRAFHEIGQNLKKTRYIPNFDNYYVQERRRILREIFAVEIEVMTEKQINYFFNKHIYKSVKELERDLDKIS